MVLLTYQLPESIIKIAKGGEFNEFDLNVFFSAEGEGKEAKFKYESDVQKWLDLIRGQHIQTTLDNLKLGAKKPPLPYSDSRFLNILTHTFWFLPSVASCHAMANLLSQKNNVFYHDYKINIAAGPEAGIGVNALPPVLDSMRNPLESKTITLSAENLQLCNVKPWTGIFIAQKPFKPETYFQASFSGQYPWIFDNRMENPNKGNHKKKNVYVF